jgi:hypothetical protein
VVLKSLGQAGGPILATSIMTSFTQPLTKAIGGQTVFIGNFPNATSFNLIYVVGIVLTIFVAGLSPLSKNYIFHKEKIA